MSILVSTQKDDQVMKVAITGEVDVSNAADLRSALDAALADDVKTVEVDVAQVPYIDSTGIGVLVGAAHRAADAQKDLVVLHPQRNVARVLSLLGVADELGIKN